MFFLCTCVGWCPCFCMCVCVLRCVHMQGMGPSEGIQPRPEAVGDWKDYRRDVAGPDWWGETGLPEWVWSWEGELSEVWLLLWLALQFIYVFCPSLEAKLSWWEVKMCSSWDTVHYFNTVSIVRLFLRHTFVISDTSNEQTQKGVSFKFNFLAFFLSLSDRV